MSKTVTILDEFKINYLTQAQYDAEVAGGTVQPDELYLTLDESASKAQTLTNKTIDKADNTVTCTPTVISASTTLNPTKEMYVIVDTADVTITLGTAPYDGYALSIMSVAGNSCNVQYTYNGTTVTDEIWGVQPTSYIYLGSGTWRIAEGSTLRTFTGVSGVNDWKTYRGNGTYTFFYSASGASSIYDTPTSFGTVTITWGAVSQASAICVSNYHSSGNENYASTVWVCNYADGTWNKWTRIIGKGEGTLHTVTSLASGWSGTVWWSVQNGICTLCNYSQCTSTGTSKTLLTNVPKSKMTTYGGAYANRGCIYVEAGGTTLKAHVSTANANLSSSIAYPVADDWAE